MARGRPPGVPQPAPTLEVLIAGGAHTEVARLAVAIGEARVERGWTYHQLAEASGVNRAIVAAVEACRRDPALSTLIKLREALGVDWSRLLP